MPVREAYDFRMDSTQQPTVKLTQKLVRAYIRTLGGTFRKDYCGDYIVRFNNGEFDYHTDNLEDALGAARIYQGTNPNIETAEALLGGYERL